MRIQHDGISLWYATPDAPGPSDIVLEGSEISITIGVTPIDPSNKVSGR